MSSHTIDVNTTIRQVFVRILPRHILDNITFVIFAFKNVWKINFARFCFVLAVCLLRVNECGERKKWTTLLYSNVVIHQNKET